MRFVKGFGRFWYDFVIGDDWKTTFAVVLVLAVGGILVAGGWVGTSLLAPALAVGVAVAFVVALLIDVRTR